MTSYYDTGKSFFPTLAPTATPLNLTSISSYQGYSIIGANYDSQSGWSVSGAGDVNGDGYDDMITCAINGYAYIIYGSVNNSTIYLDNLGNKGVYIYGGMSGFSCSVSGAGDINNDGYDDVVVFIGGEYDYVIYGGKSIASSINIRTLGNKGISITISGVGFEVVSGAGDINRDGYDDIILGSCCVGNYNTGNVYIMYGNVSLPHIIDLNQSSAKSVFIPGVIKESYTGYSVSGTGDVNGDGFDDVIIGAYGANKAYVIYGSINLPSTINLANLGVYGFYINGSSNTEFGATVSSIGDINKDSYDDIIILSPMGIGAYVIFGNSSLPNTINVETAIKNYGFTVTGGYGSYLSASGVGDINKDGYCDFIIGTIWDTSYILYGNIIFPNTIDIDDLSGSQGFAAVGSSSTASGQSVSGTGDVNGDGFVDCMIGAPGSSTSYIGESYIIYGAASDFATSKPSSAPTTAPADVNSGDSTETADTDVGLISGLSICGAALLGVAGYAFYAYTHHMWPFAIESLASKAAEIESSNL